MPIGASNYRDYMAQLLEEVPEMAQTGRQYVDIIGAQAPQAGMHDFIAPDLRESLEGQMQGMRPAEYEAARRRITQGYQTAVGGLASKAAQAGHYAPASVAQAAAGKPTASLVNALQQLEGTRAKMRREGSASAARTLGGLYQHPAAQAKAAQEAYGQSVQTQTIGRNIDLFNQQNAAGLYGRGYSGMARRARGFGPY